MILRYFLITLHLVVTAGLANAQQPESEKPIQVDPVVHKLDGVTSRMTAYLKAVPTFHISTETQWSLDGQIKQTGGSRYTLAVQHPSAFRLEVASESGGNPALLCASDGTTLTRFYHDGKLAIFSRQQGGLGNLLDDAMTDASLKGSGLDIILRPDAHLYIMASVSKIKDCGQEAVRDRKAHHFSATWHQDAQVDFWIAADHEPVLLRWKRTQKMEIAGKSHKVQIDSMMKWKIDTDFSKDQTVIKTPPDAIEVTDLQGYLLKGGTDKLVGKLAPDVSLRLLDGSSWELAKHRGKQPVVLYFFATWATPSTHDLPAILSVVKPYEKRGVAFYAVDVGEAADTVRAFSAAKEHSHAVVLDVKQEAATAYRVTSLPVTVVIDKDGTIQAAHVGTESTVRALIKHDLDQLRKEDN